MAVRSIFNIFAFLYLNSFIYGSFIKLSNGGYDDIMIAIHPGLQEDADIIEKIKEMVIDASSYLFNATGNRLYINSVKILLPSTWTSKHDYIRRQRETYEKADVIIENPSPKYGDDPYTLQYRGCGEPGKYIHLTPNFLLNDSLSLGYGSAGRVFVHEWAHLRYGIFDEYSSEIPYYISTDLKIEATRCSENLRGSNVINKCEGDSCTIHPCSIASNTGLYEEGCIFLPEKFQHVQESIMYLQILPSVSTFCNESNHNIEAPNLQNRICNLYSTWEVIKNSTDISSTLPRPNLHIPVPTFTYLQYKTRIITVAIDISGSMNSFGRIGRLYQAAEFFLMQVIETGSYAGIVEFASAGYAFVTSNLVNISGQQDRVELISKIPSTTLNSGANICVGILKALQVNKMFDGSSAGTEILLITDGEDDLSKCYNDILDSGAVIHVIALGSGATQQLENIADKSGGQKHFATDRPDSNDLINAFSAITKGDGDSAQQTVLLESTSYILEPEECLNNTIFIDSTVGICTFFLVTWQAAVPTINIQDPQGNLYMEAQFINNTNSKSSRLQITGKAESGIWNYTLCNSLNPQAIGMVVTSKAADTNVPPITANVHMSQDTSIYPNPMIVYASVRHGTTPVIGVKVKATIEFESGSSLSIELLDNGAGADTFKNDGIYSKYFIAFAENGRHNLKIHIKGVQTEDRTEVTTSHAFYVPGYVENGTISLNAPRPAVNEGNLQTVVKHISRTASGGSFRVNNVPTSSQSIAYKPGKINDLEAKAQGNLIVLTWTATGDDLDKGRVSRYELRSSTNPRHLRDNFQSSTDEDISSHLPKEAGSLEKFIFVPRDTVTENRTVLYFALIAIDKDNQKSDVSNIAQAITQIAHSTTPTTQSTSGISLTSSDSSTLKITDQPFEIFTTTSSKVYDTPLTPTNINNTLPPSYSSVPLLNSSIPPYSNNTPTVMPLSPTDNSIIRTNDQPHTNFTTINNITKTTIYFTLTPSFTDDNTLTPTNINNTLLPIFSSLPPMNNSIPPYGNNSLPTVNSIATADNNSEASTIVQSTSSSFPVVNDSVSPYSNTNNITSYSISTVGKNTTAMSEKSKSTARSSTMATFTTHANFTISLSSSDQTNTLQSTEKINVTVVVVVACASVVLIIIIICVTVYSVKYCKHRSYLII